MNRKMRKAFTLVELMVAVGLLALILSFAGIVFNASIDTYRTAAANAEIMRKFRAITDQLDADFENLCKTGEIFVIWKQVNRRPDFTDCDLDGFERFDRIMFFATGDFETYGTTPMLRGDLARISYMLATRQGQKAELQPRRERILARTQHILATDTSLGVTLDPNNFTDQQWKDWHNLSEYDLMPAPDAVLSLDKWKHIPWIQKQDMLAMVADVNVGTSAINPNFKGAHVDPQNPSTIHNLLCEGVGEFKIQSWYEQQGRWIPEIDPDGNGVLTDTDFFLTPGDPNVPGVLYPYRISVPPENYGGVNIASLQYSQTNVTEANFNSIPGLGRALKFTFTLFDSKGIIEDGRVFTHIVYLEK